MTEYDYSPDAYERYMQTQERIANWVQQTEDHRPGFNDGGGDSPRGRPSFFQRLSHGRHKSLHEPHRQPDSSSSSWSGRDYHSDSPRSPGPMPVPAYQPGYPQQPPVTTYYLPKQSSRHRSPHHHHHHRSSHRSPGYVIAQPISQPPYSGMTQTLSPEPYGYPTKPGASTASSQSYLQPSAPGYYPQNAYPAPAAYPNNMQPSHLPRTAPATTTYGYYGQVPVPPLASPPTHYPQTAAYPPTIYPLQPYGGVGQQQQLQQKPVFYQRIFSGSGGGKKGKKSSKRSY